MMTTPVLATAFVCLSVGAASLAGQSRYSSLVGLGIGAVPAERRHVAVAGSAGIFRRLGSTVDLGIEVGYQRFGATPQLDIIGRCPILPAGACIGEITADLRQRGDLWFVGPTARLRVMPQGGLRLFFLAGLARYVSTEHTTITYRDDRDVTVPIPESFDYKRRFDGAGVNAAVGIEGGKLTSFRWILMARAHGAVGGIGSEIGSLSAWTVTAGLALP